MGKGFWRLDAGYKDRKKANPLSFVVCERERKRVLNERVVGKYSAVCRASGLFTYDSAEFSSCFELNDFFRSDFDSRAGTGVAAGTSGFFGYAERAEAYQSDFIAGFEGFARYADKGFEGFFCLSFGQSCFGSDCIDKLRFIHNSNDLRG